MAAQRLEGCSSGVVESFNLRVFKAPTGPPAGGWRSNSPIWQAKHGRGLEAPSGSLLRFVKAVEDAALVGALRGLRSGQVGLCEPACACKASSVTPGFI